MGAGALKAEVSTREKAAPRLRRKDAEALARTVPGGQGQPSRRGGREEEHGAGKQSNAEPWQPHTSLTDQHATRNTLRQKTNASTQKNRGSTANHSLISVAFNVHYVVNKSCYND